MRGTVVAICLTLCLLPLPAVGQEALGAKVAFIKDNEVYTANADGSGLQQLTKDGAEKYAPRWSGDGKRLAYQRQVERMRAVADIQVISADGNLVREILFRPPGSGMGMRGVERMWWSGDSRLVLFGDASPYSCEFVAIAADTGQTIADYGGFCPSFVESPDKSHVACASGPGVGSGPEENWRQGLEINGRAIFPPWGVVPTGRFLSGIQWSADSKSVAVLELDVPTGVTYATVATTAGVVNRTPLPASFEMPMILTWAGNTLVLEADGDRYRVDTSAKVLRQAGPDEEERLARDADAKRSVESARKRAREAARKLGAHGDEDIDVFIPEVSGVQ